MSPVPLAGWKPDRHGPSWSAERADWPQPLPAHVGIWLDRDLPEPARSDGGEKGWWGRRRLYEVAIAALRPAPSGRGETPALAAYRELFRRWRRSFEEDAPGLTRRVFEVAARSRILLHPATGSSVTEGSILLHHTYGVPYLPGSALKGAARRRLRELGAAAGGEEGPPPPDELLGRVGAPRLEPAPKALASLVDFLDALWIPEPPPRVLPTWSPLALDVVNPHHPDYYTAPEGARPLPSDADDPIPVHRLSLAPGCRFLVVLEAAASPALAPWLDWLRDAVLLPALAEDGLGAWTAAGYGRLAAVAADSREPARKAPHPAPTAPAPPAWQPAHLDRVAGTGEVVAVLADGRHASARGEAAQELLAALPENLRARLFQKKRREVPVEVGVEQEGLAWRLVRVRKQGSGTGAASGRVGEES